MSYFLHQCNVSVWGLALPFFMVGCGLETAATAVTTAKLQAQQVQAAQQQLDAVKRQLDQANVQLEGRKQETDAASR